MNNIEITEEQKVKLLEMSNTLFKGTIINGYTIDRILMSNQQGSCGMHSRQESQVFIYIAEQMGFPINIIHWFEFSMIDLIDELAFRNIKTDIVADIEFENYRINIIKELFKDRPNVIYHPIDYLYEQFKLIK